MSAEVPARAGMMGRVLYEAGMTVRQVMVALLADIQGMPSCGRDNGEGGP